MRQKHDVSMQRHRGKKMILVRTTWQIRTCRMIPSFRACQTLSGLDLSKSDSQSDPFGNRARQVGASAEMLASVARREWLLQQWKRH